MKLLPVILCASLIGCASLGKNVQTASQASEAAETGAELLYAAIATTVNTYEGLPSTSASQKAAAQAIEVKAWADLGNIRSLYAAGQSITGALGALTADQASAASTTGMTVVAPATAPVGA